MESKNYSGIMPYEEKDRREEGFKFALSGEGLKRINFKLYNNNFEFRFKNNKSFKIPDLLAEFLSPVVSNLRSQDPDITFFSIDEDVTDEALEKLEMLIQGETIIITGFGDPLVNIFGYLENSEFSILPFEMTKEHLSNILNIKTKLRQSIDKEIVFGAIHFEEIKDQNFTMEQFMKFLSCDKLKITSEKSLLNFIEQKMKQDPEYYILLKFIHCEYLNEENSNKFVAIVDSLANEENKIRSLWPAIKTLNNKQSIDIFEKRFSGIQFKFDGTHRFNGIFNYLTEQTKGNIISNETINALDINCQNCCLSIEKIVENDESSAVISQNRSLILDFKDKKISITEYSILSQQIARISRLDKLILNGSNDKKHWETIHKFEDSYGWWYQCTEKTLKTENQKVYRYIGLTNMVNDRVSLNRIDFFGTLYE